MENHCATCGTVLVEKKLFPLPSLNISFMLCNLCLLCFTLQPYTTTKGPGSIFCCPWVLGSCCRVHPEATWRKLQAEQALLLQPHQSLWPSWQSLLTLSSSWSLLILPTPLGPPAGLFDRAALQSGNPPTCCLYVQGQELSSLNSLRSLLPIPFPHLGASKWQLCPQVEDISLACCHL